MDKDDDSLRQELSRLVETCLESARVEVARRLKARGMPLSIDEQRLLILDHPSGGGWNSELAFDRVSGLCPREAILAIRDESVPNLALGLRDELSPLAQYLAENTDIAPKRYGELLGRDPIDGLLFRCISPLAHYYLTSLTDIGRPRPSLVSNLAADLYRLATGDVMYHVYHLTVAGIRPKSRFEHQDVSIRPLTPRERGAWASKNLFFEDSSFMGDDDYRPSSPFPATVPSTLVEITSARAVGQTFDTSSLPNKVTLAFYLLGYRIGSSGYISHFDRPPWSSMGRHTTPFPVSEQIGLGNIELTRREFNRVIDFAYQMPDFTSAETNAYEVALWRVLRGCGTRWPDSAFIDFAIALEAALLRRRGSELAYRFSLYGSLFLRSELEPADTFRRLKDIYTVRSKLVHGETIAADRRHHASQDAMELAKAVLLKAIKSGWPDADALDALAVG